MEILKADEIRAWDQFTIQHEPISSLELMERAAAGCTSWLLKNGYQEKSFSIFCGKGNNGGDGLAIARQLLHHGKKVDVFVIEHGQKGTDDFQANLEKLHTVTTSIHFISKEDSIHPIAVGDIIIDAIFGLGLNKPTTGLEQMLIGHLNQSGNTIISIDIPSGLFADSFSGSSSVVHATHTLSFQCYKKAFLVADNSSFVGSLHILDIGLHPAYPNQIPGKDKFIDKKQLQDFFKPRNKFSHKGQFGHAALIAGSIGMMGAATMAALACLRSGVGKLTSIIPGVGLEVIQLSVPESIAICSGEDYLKEVKNLAAYDAIGIGPGIGCENSHSKLIQDIFKNFTKPIIIDADGLNIIAQNQFLLEEIPPYSIITPHPGEFDRLFGKSSNGFERIEKARQKANELGIIIVLKGRYTTVAIPTGICYFNTTGNCGMAKAGNGDVLTGIILALLSQGYKNEEASLLGVYLHGLAADLALEDESVESLLATDSIKFIGRAFISIGEKV